ncbi:hypothetical protein N7448_006866 [Penicillium atrosanguineum]|uniref:Transcription elongation factor Eaf N-terminal domain-containing protein n=1 Tax=Penicillium atrosanguineum TaxID=1132637 RepID=A0A9W9L1W9_9EURO|nr:Calcium/calmodulin-dependent protein kinase cmkB [Penicillium atrosanguineum]KAJ5132708.1 hypothetical protein N7448_006866 [Penicillium atrosanguineum]KAJ5141402.1 hypothetical protein N7526_002397 [Penicillium atrosanguineum]KAJ5290376.1 Calcium/calmodulin-dependent protein kinase cmkB [Penicillium atrosanguineum]KAJ5308198.1 hypothetical protein N7476_008854 [Penicillium atrosanguineum]
MAAPTMSTMIDPTKQAEYPIVLGERLANSDLSRLINVNYNYKTKAATPQQRSTISRSSQSSDLYDLSVTDKAPSADQTLTYSYKGSEDPAAERNLVLIFDPDRKVFVLEPVSTKLNFNLRSAPSKSEKQVLEQYEQLRIVEGEEHTTSGDDRNTVTTSEDEGPADESNPYDFRHFLPKQGARNVKPASGHSTPEPGSTSRANTPLMMATKPAAKPMPRPKKQANPLRETKHPAKPPASANPPKQAEPPAQQSTRADPPEPAYRRDSISDAGTASQQSVQSPDSNIIVDGDLIIDMGSPPPARAFKVDASFFSSNNTPTDGPEDDGDGDEEMGDFRLPSPAGHTKPASVPAAAPDGDDMDDEDLLAAEMEAAFEESAREEEARSQQYSHAASRYNVASDDESEVSEEE